MSVSERIYDAIIIGGGAVGCAAARELSRYDLDIAVLEKGNDVALGASKANSGLVHAGYDAKPGTLKAKMNVRGNILIAALSRKLRFGYRRTGAFVLCFSEEERPVLAELKQRGALNGVADLETLDGAQIRKREPNVSKQAVAGLFAPSAGVVCPYGMTVALAENAAENGVEFHFLQEVTEIARVPGAAEREIEAGQQEVDVKRECAQYTAKRAYFLLKSAAGAVYRAKTVVNAAGIYADKIHNMVCAQKIEILPRRGEYCLLDRASGGITSSTLFRLPDKMGKGVLVTPTADGNILIDPTAEDIGDKEDVATTRAGLDAVLRKGARSVENLNPHEIIAQYAGLRARLAHTDDFMLGECADADGFFDAAGIDSPGLTAAPAIGEYLAERIAQKLGARKKERFIETRAPVKRFADAGFSEQEKLIRENPHRGKIVCRCEAVTEAEIIDSLGGNIPAVDLDGVKRRTRAQMGRCQGGFCAPQIIEIIAREKGTALTAVQKAGGAPVLAAQNKDNLEGGGYGS